MTAVYVVLYDKLPVGVNVAVISFKAAVPGIVVLPLETVNVSFVIVLLSIGSEKVADIFELTGIFVEAFAGSVELTAGGVLSSTGFEPESFGFVPCRIS